MRSWSMVVVESEYCTMLVILIYFGKFSIIFCWTTVVILGCYRKFSSIFFCCTTVVCLSNMRPRIATNEFTDLLLTTCGLVSHTTADMQIDDRFGFFVRPCLSSNKYMFAVLLLSKNIFRPMTLFCQGSVRLTVTDLRAHPSELKLTSFRADTPDYDTRAAKCIAFGPDDENFPRDVLPKPVSDSWWEYCTECDMGQVDFSFRDSSDYFLRDLKFEE